jgi:hypothetical protein
MGDAMAGGSDHSDLTLTLVLIAPRLFIFRLTSALLTCHPPSTSLLHKFVYQCFFICGLSSGCPVFCLDVAVLSRGLASPNGEARDETSGFPFQLRCEEKSCF